MILGQALTWLLAAGPVTAQGPAEGVHPGDTLYVSYVTSCRKSRHCQVAHDRGTLLDWTAEALAVARLPAHEPLHFSTVAPAGERLRTVRRGHARTGFLIGAATGAVLGAASGWVLGSATCAMISWGSDPGCTHTGAGIVGAFVGAIGTGAVFGVAGSVIGVMVRSDAWVLEPQGDGFRPVAGTVGIVVRIEHETGVHVRQIWPAAPEHRSRQP